LGWVFWCDDGVRVFSGVGLGIGWCSSASHLPRTLFGPLLPELRCGSTFGKTLVEREEGRETHGAHDVVRREVLLGNIEGRIVLKMPARGKCLVG
jgi:hypothetical protein